MTIEMNFFRNPRETRTFNAGETIFNEGDEGNVMYGVVAGTVHIIYKGKLLNVIEPGGPFGEMALVDDSPRSASAVAHTDVTLEVVTKERFKFMVQESPIFALFVMQVMAQRMRDMLGHE